MFCRHPFFVRAHMRDADFLGDRHHLVQVSACAVELVGVGAEGVVFDPDF